MNALLRIVGWILALALVVLPVVAVLNGWIGAGHWPLTRLRATGEFRRVDGAQLRQTLLPYARRGFFAVDLEAAQAAVAKLPWVESAEVRKRWPDVLEVHVTEHRPFALWEDDQLLSEQGCLFPARGVAIPAGLPRFRGPRGRADELVGFYNEARALFSMHGIPVREVELDPRGSWALRLGNGLHVTVGRNEARARLQRFVRLLPQLVAQDPRRLERADLRYTNGFALSWSKPAAGNREPGVAGAPLAVHPVIERSAPRFVPRRVHRPAPSPSLLPGSST